VKELLKTRFIKFPLENANYIRDIKLGKYTPEKVIDDIQDVLDEVDELLLKTDMQNESNRELMDDIIIDLLV